jgi:hypothetical protein
MVKSLLYVSACTTSPFGVSSSSRMPTAKRPPSTNMIVTDTR